MPRIIDDHFMVCVDCILIIANDDDSGMTEERAREVRLALDRNSSNGTYICCGDSENDHDFSWSECDCCGSRLGGSRHHCTVFARD
jgi:hypothetical protein